MSSSDNRPVAALTIAGSDSGGGAGIQADLKTFAAHDVHGLSAFAALTAQNTRAVTAVHVPPVSFLRAQIDACFDDFRIGAVKLGMLANAAIIGAVADALEQHEPSHIVLDPVMVATSGARLLEHDALDALRSRLLPLATIVTPNIPEAELLLGHPVEDDAAADAALTELQALGARATLLKGGHLKGAGRMVDRFHDGRDPAAFAHDRLEVEGHGTGCTLASAIAANLCRGVSLLDACSAATDYVHGALLHATRPGRSPVAVLDHFWKRHH
ncbi:MAG: bifunctional hydroxymethylpyrimidine kinase/phosphomethylpyrimidine kinase [Burkholderiales bacterium]